MNTTLKFILFLIFFSCISCKNFTFINKEKSSKIYFVAGSFNDIYTSIKINEKIVFEGELGKADVNGLFFTLNVRTKRKFKMQVVIKRNQNKFYSYDVVLSRKEYIIISHNVFEDKFEISTSNHPPPLM